MKRMLALLLFDVGSLLVLAGAYLQGEDKQHINYIKWSNRVERKALNDAFETK